MKQIERRFVKGGQVRAKKDDKPGIEGVASVYNQDYDNGWFIERVKPGAFRRVLGENPDVRCLFNHNPNNVLGRTKSGTLRIADSSSGLGYECDTDPNTSIGRDVPAMIERGDVDGCSFSFTVSKQVWREEKAANGDTTLIREIEEFDELLDVGPVTYPAYTGTSVGARSLWPDGVPDDISSHVQALRNLAAPARRSADACDCECDPCMNGDCAGCNCTEGCDAGNCSGDGCRCNESDRARVCLAEARLRIAEASAA